MDPRLDATGPQQRKANLSPLMQRLNKASQGEKVNVCPFGCPDEALDEHGYCDHLVGTTTDGKVLEPMVKDEQGRRHTQGNRPQAVLPTDKLERITVSSRVYRELPAEAGGGKKKGQPA